jgi:hypothetical protein
MDPRISFAKTNKKADLEDNRTASPNFIEVKIEIECNKSFPRIAKKSGSQRKKQDMK